MKKYYLKEQFFERILEKIWKNKEKSLKTHKYSYKN